MDVMQKLFWYYRLNQSRFLKYVILFGIEWLVVFSGKNGNSENRWDKLEAF